MCYNSCWGLINSRMALFVLTLSRHLSSKALIRFSMQKKNGNLCLFYRRNGILLLHNHNSFLNLHKIEYYEE